MESKHYKSDVTEIRKRAREDLKAGAVTGGYRADRKAVIHLLNAALATELVCVLRYKHHYFMASGLNAQTAADEFLEHANEEQNHANKLASRIVQLGGEPDFSPGSLVERSHSEYVAPATLAEMIREDLVAERIAIDSYRAMVQYMGEDDPTTRRVLEEILAVEEEHADDLLSLMQASPEGEELIENKSS